MEENTTSEGTEEQKTDGGAEDTTTENDTASDSGETASE